MLGTAKLVGTEYYSHGNKHTCSGVYKLVPNWKPTDKHISGYPHIAILVTDTGREVRPLNSHLTVVEWETPFDDETALAVLGYKLEQ